MVNQYYCGSSNTETSIEMLLDKWILSRFKIRLGEELLPKLRMFPIETIKILLREVGEM